MGSSPRRRSLSASDIKTCEKVLKELVNYEADDGYGIMDSDTYYAVIEAIESYENSEQSKSKSKTKEKKSPKTTAVSCEQKTSKQYTNRPSPPFIAKECPGERRRGNSTPHGNNEMYESRADKNGTYRWYKIH